MFNVEQYTELFNSGEELDVLEAKLQSYLKIEVVDLFRDNIDPLNDLPR